MQRLRKTLTYLLTYIDLTGLSASATKSINAVTRYTCTVQTVSFST